MSTLESAIDKAAELLIAQALECAMATGAVNTEFVVAEILECALAHQVAGIIGDRGTFDRLQQGITATQQRLPAAILRAHFARFGSLSRQ